MPKIKKVKDFVNKEKCNCGQVAVYWYMPAYDGKNKEQSYYCEACVPRGCSCEWKYIKDFQTPSEDKAWKWIVMPPNDNNYEIKEGEVWVHLDENGKEYPCCEFMYQEKGYDKH